MDSAEQTSLRIPDSRVALYLVFSAELSFLAALTGAYVLLRFSATVAQQFSSQAASRLLYVLAGYLLIHTLAGILTQLLSKKTGVIKNLRVFWKLTAVLYGTVIIPVLLGGQP